MRALLRSLTAPRRGPVEQTPTPSPYRTEFPEHDPAVAFRLPTHGGDGYLEVLAQLHRALQPRTYLEVGTATGTSLQHAQCASLAIDPAFELDKEVVGRKPRCLFFQEAADGFFAREDARALLGGPVDLAFLDGMHEFEFLLRDFMGAEAVAAPESVILLHDCLPTDSHVARRDPGDLTHEALAPHPGWWAGDVWKAAAILKRWRPDLTIRAIDAPPTGLIAVSDLDPRSRVLRDAYDEAVAAFRDVTLGQAEAEAFRAGFAPLPSTTLMEEGGAEAAFPRTAAWRASSPPG